MTLAEKIREFSHDLPEIVFRNPVLIKELRAGLRGKAFMVRFMLAVGLFAGALLIVFYTYTPVEGSYSGEPAEIGMTTFSINYMILLVLVFLFLPSVNATSVSSERESQTFELLLASGLSPARIIWGKFLAAWIQSLVMLSATLPLICLTMLLGGVTIGNVLACYVVVSALAAFVVAYSLFCSSVAAKPARTVAAAYLQTIFYAFILSTLLGSIVTVVAVTRHPAYYGAGYYSPDEAMFAVLSWYGAPTRYSPLPFTLGNALHIYGIPLFLLAYFIAFYLTASTNRTKLPHENRTTNMKVLYLIFALIVPTALTLEMALAISGLSYYSSSYFREAFAVVLCTLGVLFFISSGFALEPHEPPVHLRERLSRTLNRFKLGALHRILTPGSRAGVIFCILINSLLLIGCIALFVLATLPLCADYLGTMLPLGGLIALWNINLCLGASLFSSFCGKRRTLAKGLFFGGIILFLCISPVSLIHWHSSRDPMPLLAQLNPLLAVPFIADRAPRVPDEALAMQLLIAFVLFMFVGRTRLKGLPVSRVPRIVHHGRDARATGSAGAPRSSAGDETS